MVGTEFSIWEYTLSIKQSTELTEHQCYGCAYQKEWTSRSFKWQTVAIAQFAPFGIYLNYAYPDASSDHTCLPPSTHGVPSFMLGLQGYPSHFHQSYLPLGLVLQIILPERIQRVKQGMYRWQKQSYHPAYVYIFTGLCPCHLPQVRKDVSQLGVYHLHLWEPGCACWPVRSMWECPRRHDDLASCHNHHNLVWRCDRSDERWGVPYSYAGSPIKSANR